MNGAHNAGNFQSPGQSSAPARGPGYDAAGKAISVPSLTDIRFRAVNLVVPGLMFLVGLGLIAWGISDYGAHRTHIILVFRVVPIVWWTLIPAGALASL